LHIEGHSKTTPLLLQPPVVVPIVVANCGRRPAGMRAICRICDQFQLDQ
jgi:hypothetical protein